MLDISATHPFEACAAFAVQFLARIAAYDLPGAEALIDVNDSDGPFAASFPAPDGFTYAHPDSARDWTMSILGINSKGLKCDFDVPFGEEEYRPMNARFYMRRLGSQLEVHFEGLVPS